MQIIGERITVTNNKVAKAFKAREIDFILKLAREQFEQGIEFLDVSIGPATKGGPELMEWLVTNIQNEIDVPISLDSTNINAIEAGLKVHKGTALVNSASGQEGRKEPVFELAAKYNAKVVGLTMTDEGIPRDENERCVVAFDLITVAQSFGISPDDIYLDPLALPVSVQQDQAMKIINSIAMFKELSDPPTKSTIGLSNFFNGMPHKIQPWIGGTCLALLEQNGMTTPIADPGYSKLFEIKDKALELLSDESKADSSEEFKNIMKTLRIIRCEDLFSSSYLD
jgi:5-methyltetrahydrofolate corrinoid/iron sulfur protein methyltransferase